MAITICHPARIRAHVGAHTADIEILFWVWRLPCTHADGVVRRFCLIGVDVQYRVLIRIQLSKIFDDVDVEVAWIRSESLPVVMS